MDKTLWILCGRMVELVFEKYGAPAVFLAKNAVLTNVL
jgi:hypothetical protein